MKDSDTLKVKMKKGRFGQLIDWQASLDNKPTKKKQTKRKHGRGRHGPPIGIPGEKVRARKQSKKGRRRSRSRVKDRFGQRTW